MKIILYLSSILLASTSYSYAQEKPVFERPVRIEASGKPIEINGGYAHPTVVDVDNDGLNDLVIGKLQRGGIDFYKT